MMNNKATNISSNATVGVDMTSSNFVSMEQNEDANANIFTTAQLSLQGLKSVYNSCY